MDIKKIGEFICKMRQERGLMQKELADIIGVTDKAISKWERGKGLPDVTLLEPLAKALNVSVAELLSGEIITDNNKQQTNEAMIQALEHYKRSQRRIVGILLIILGAVLLLALAVHIVGQWYYLAFIFGLVAIATGIVVITTKKSLAFCKIPKTVAQWVSFGALAAAIVLEALPYGVVAIFSAGPEYDKIVELYSYFDFLPFGYGEFAPLITAILTVLLAALAFALIFVKRPLNKLRTTQYIATIVAAVISVGPMFYGDEYMTIIGIFITLLLVASAVFCAITYAKRDIKENKITRNATTE